VQQQVSAFKYNNQISHFFSVISFIYFDADAGGNGFQFSPRMEQGGDVSFVHHDLQWCGMINAYFADRGLFTVDVDTFQKIVAISCPGLSTLATRWHTITIYRRHIQT